MRGEIRKQDLRTLQRYEYKSNQWGKNTALTKYQRGNQKKHLYVEQMIQDILRNTEKHNDGIDAVQDISNRLKPNMNIH